MFDSSVRSEDSQRHGLSKMVVVTFATLSKVITALRLGLVCESVKFDSFWIGNVSLTVTATTRKKLSNIVEIWLVHQVRFSQPVFHNSVM